MAQLVGDFILERLHAWGVTRIYGYPGDGINGIVGALDRAEDKIDFVQVRHEEMSAFMACGHAKFTGEVGVCLATSGPGAIHLLNGLYDAKMDHTPVVAIVGQQDRRALGGHYQQEVDLINLFKDVASEYVHMASVPDQVRHLIDRAVRIAKDQRTVTCVIVPNDVQEMDAVTEPAHEHGTIHSGVGYSEPTVVPRDDDLDKAAQILNSGDKIAMLIGAGAKHAEDELMEVAEILGAGVAKALLGRQVLDDSLPYVTGPIGLLGSKPSWDLMMDCDTLLMVGTSFPYSEFLPKEGPGSRGRNKYRRAHDRDSLSNRVQPRWRQQGDAQSAHVPARAKEQPFVAQEDREGGQAVVEARRGASPSRSGSNQSTEGLL